MDKKLLDALETIKKYCNMSDEDCLFCWFATLPDGYSGVLKCKLREDSPRNWDIDGWGKDK